MGRLADDRDAALDEPAQQDVRRALSAAVSDVGDDGVAQVRAGSKWAVGLERDTRFDAGVEERPAVLRIWSSTARTPATPRAVRTASTRLTTPPRSTTSPSSRHCTAISA